MYIYIYVPFYPLNLNPYNPEKLPSPHPASCQLLKTKLLKILGLDSTPQPPAQVGLEFIVVQVR